MTATARGGPQRIPRPPGSAPGRPAPWAQLAAEARGASINLVRRRFAGRVGRPSAAEDDGMSRGSAVLVALYPHDGDVVVILTRRAQHLRAHQGEVAFPGGAVEPGETPVAAALREAREEIGLDPAAVEIVGELDHLMTVTSRSFIVPFVGILTGPPELTPDPGEVEAVLHIPLGELLADEPYREERWVLGEAARPIFFFELVGDTVWGATAAMLRQFLALLLDVPAEMDHP